MVGLARQNPEFKETDYFTVGMKHSCSWSGTYSLSSTVITAPYSEGIIFPFMVVYNTNIFENIVQNKEQSGAHSRMFKKVRDPWKVISQ